MNSPDEDSINEFLNSLVKSDLVKNKKKSLLNAISANKIDNANLQIEETKEASLFLFDDSLDVFYHDIQNATKSIYISTNYLKKVPFLNLCKYSKKR